ncbi:MAG: MerR family transcriptional regulator [Desulfobacteraceae bacterium]|nr:MAG: MerR family transcriptional regulator [Desulfobacteraceae bacterium]
MEFTAKDLAAVTGERLSTAKRWTRLFLAPDPEVGLQRGRQRLFSEEEAFTVFMAGYLVSKLGFSVADAKIILGDLLSWMKKQGIYPERGITESPVKTWHAEIMTAEKGFFYHFHGTVEHILIDKTENIYQERFVVKLLQGKGSGQVDLLRARKLNLSNLVDVFRSKSHSN